MQSKGLIAIILVSIYITVALGQNEYDIVGKWKWCTGTTPEFKADHTVISQDTTGTWSYKAGGIYEIKWGNGYLDVLRLSADGQSLDGYNQYNLQNGFLNRHFADKISSCQLQVNGQGLHPRDSRIFIVSGIYSGTTQTMLRINYVTDAGIAGQSPPTQVEPNTTYSIETMPVLTRDTSRIDYRVEYLDDKGNWQTCGGDHTFQEYYR